jgi:prevent-host-death family protein
MKLTEAVRPISYLKAHASELLRDVADNRNPLVITMNGEAAVVVQDVASYEEMCESLALLKMLAQSRDSAEAGRTSPLRESMRRIRRALEEAE